MPAPLGVRLELTTRLGRSGSARITELLGRLGLAAGAFPTRLRTRLTIARGHRRVDFLGNGPLGKNVTMVSAPTGSLWIQHDAGVFIAVEASGAGPKGGAGEERTPKSSRAVAHFGGPVAAESPAQSKRPASSGTTVVRDSESGRSIRISVTPNPEWRAPELAGEAVAALLGGPDGQLPGGIDGAALAGLFREQGLPSRIRFEILDEEGDGAELLATVEVPFLAGFTSTNSVPGILLEMKVKASTTSDRDLSL